jgi:HEAT repeat protein
MRIPISRAAAVLATVIALLPLAAVCTQEGSAQTDAGVVTMPGDDTASIARFMSAVRGVSPLLCELATRAVDRHGSWWDRDSPGADPLEVDSASAALISWAQRDHTDPALVPKLRAWLRDTDGCVRRIAGSFLARVNHPTAEAALISALDEASVETRHAAAIGLGLREKSTRAVEPLVRHLRDDSPLVRRSAAWALGELEATEALPPLIETLQRDADARVRQSAAWALGKISG